MLNAQDISADKIKSGIGGYKKKATKEFIDAVRGDYEALYKENLELKDKLSILSDGVQYYKNMEKSLQKALVLAEKTTSETMHAAEVKAAAMEKEAQTRASTLTKEAKIRADAYEKEATIKAENIIKDAKARADHAILESNEELRKIHSKIMTLVQQYEQYKSQYKQLAMAQMNVLESEAYNLDAPILKTISESLEKASNRDQDVILEGNIAKNEIDAQEVMDPIKRNEDSNSNPQDKKVYVDGRGEVVEVHEFREITIPGTKSKDWETSNVDDLEDDDISWKSPMKPTSFSDKESENFSKTEYHSFEPPKASSFSSNEDAMLKSTELPKTSSVSCRRDDNFVSFDTPTSSAFNRKEDVPESMIEPKMSADFSRKDATVDLSSKPNSVMGPYGEGSSLQTDSYQSYESQKSSAFFETSGNSVNEKRNTMEIAVNKSFDFDNIAMQDNKKSISYSEKIIENSDLQTNELEYLSNKNNETNNPHQISQSDMKRIAQQQMERVRLEQEKQAEFLRTGKYPNNVEANIDQESPVVKKNAVRDNVDYFSAIHNQDQEPVVTLRDLQLQQEKENKQVILPKATEESNFNSPIEEKRTEDVGNNIKRNDRSDSEERSFFQQFSDEKEQKSQFDTAENYSESKNSLDYEMDHNHSFANPITDRQKFKSLREFESEL